MRIAAFCIELKKNEMKQRTKRSNANEIAAAYSLFHEWDSVGVWRAAEILHTILQIN